MDTASPPDNGIQETWTVRDTTPAGRRLFWTLDGPLETAIKVSPSQWYELGDIMEPYFRPATTHNDVGEAGTPCQKNPFNPPAASVIVTVACLDNWEHSWIQQHIGCLEPDDDRYSERFGRHPDGDITEPNHRYLMHCCGQKRPWFKKVQLEVTSSGAFLTVHEYVSAVHPWLMAMRETLLEVLGKLVNGGPPKPDNTKLIITRPVHGPLSLGDAYKWAQCHRKPRQEPWSEAEEEQHRQRWMERYSATPAELVARYFQERAQDRERQKEYNNRLG